MVVALPWYKYVVVDPSGATTEVVVFLGQTASVDESRAVVQRYRATDLDAVLRAVTTRWDDLLAAVQVKTPDRSFDLMLNRWSLYQALSCRMWARTALYQSSGAFGFRARNPKVMVSRTPPWISRQRSGRPALA